MALTVGTNSYVTVAEATTYYGDRFWVDSSAWTDASTGGKEQALITASLRLDRLPLVGRKVDPEQALEFPRCYIFQDSGEAGETCDLEVLPNVKRAVYEEALAIISGKDVSLRLQLQAQGVTSSRLGGVAETYSGAGATLAGLASVAARDYMRPYIKSSAAFG